MPGTVFLFNIQEPLPFDQGYLHLFSAAEDDGYHEHLYDIAWLGGGRCPQSDFPTFCGQLFPHKSHNILDMFYDIYDRRIKNHSLLTRVVCTQLSY